MADIRLAIQVDSSGAIQGVRQFNAELDKTPAKAREVGGAVASAANQLKSFAGTLAGGIGIGAGFGIGSAAAQGFLSAVRSVTGAVTDGFGKLQTYSDQIVTMSQRTGQSVESLQVLKYMADTSGSSLEAVAKAAGIMSRAISDGDKDFARLGLSLEKLRAMSPDQAFAKIASTIGSIEDPMQRSAAAMAIFGKGAGEILPLLSEKFGAAADRARELGIVLGKDLLSGQEKLGDLMQESGMAWDAFQMRLSSLLADSPAVQAFFEGLGTFFGELSKEIEKNKEALILFVKDGILLMVDALGLLAKGLSNVAIAGTALSTGARGVGNLFTTGRMDSPETAAGLERVRALIGFDAQLTESTKRLREFVSAAGPAASAVRSGSFGGAFAAAAASGGKQKLSLGSLFDLQELARINTSAPLPVAVVSTSISGSPIPGIPQSGRQFDLWSDPWKFAAGGNKSVNIDGAALQQTRASISAAQALQNLANIAQLSGSKLGKALGGIFGGASGMAGGLSALFPSLAGKGKGAVDFLGKLGTWGSVAAGALSIGSSLFGLFKKKPKPEPPEPPKKATAEAWANFVGDQLSKGGAGVLAGVSGIKVATAADMQGQASIASQVFWATFKEKGLIAAAEAFRPVRDKMIETFKAAGADDAAINAMLGPMSGVVDLAGNESFRGAAEGAKGFAEALASIANAQLPMTLDQFKAFESQAVNAFEQAKQAAIDQGLSMGDAVKNAAMASGQYLTTLQDAARKYGFDLGDGVQNVIGAAQDAGVAFGASSQDRLIMSLDRLTETLGGTPPKFEAAMSRGVNDAFGAGAGIRGGASFDPDAIGRATAAALEGPLSSFARAMDARPIEINVATNVDGDALLSSMAARIERGTNGGVRFRTALEDF